VVATARGVKDAARDAAPFGCTTNMMLNAISRTRRFVSVIRDS
jgi:hypothetical protein